MTRYLSCYAKCTIFARSTHVLFLNAGDLFINPFSTSYEVNQLDKNCLYLYGYKIHELNSKAFFLQTFLRLFFSFLSLNLPTSHNAIVYPLSALSRYPFNMEYICAADYDQFIRIKSHKAYRFVYRITQPISKVSNAGFISRNLSISYREYLKISIVYNNVLAIPYWFIRNHIL